MSSKRTSLSQGTGRTGARERYLCQLIAISARELTPFPWLCSHAAHGTITASPPCWFRSLPDSSQRLYSNTGISHSSLAIPRPSLFICKPPLILPSAQLSFLPTVISKLSLSYFGTTTHSFSVPPSPLPMAMSRKDAFDSPIGI